MSDDNICDSTRCCGGDICLYFAEKTVRYGHGSWHESECEWDGLVLPYRQRGHGVIVFRQEYDVSE